MNPEQLFQLFDQIAEAPDAVTRLRQFILDLAVRGKLVPQDPNDEPASALVKRIEAKKGQLLREQKLQAVELFDPIEEGELLFSIPTGWQVIRMGWLAQKLGAGSTPLGGKSVYQSEGVPFLRSQNVHDDGLRLNDVALIPRTIHERMAGTHIQRQDLLLNITGASIGRCALVPDDFIEGNVSQHVTIIRLFEPAIRQFIHLALISPSYQKLIMDVQVGVSREGLSMQRLKLFPMALPPLAEQHRIVAKVDELMALCDQLEAAQTQRETHRDQLVAATLHSLTTVDHTAGATAFPARAHFFFNHLPRLTTRPAHIQQLRQTILNLAVCGKLVPQDPNDEPVEELLKRIEAKKTHLAELGELTRIKPVKLVSPNEYLYVVPKHWKWVRIAEISDVRLGRQRSPDHHFGQHMRPYIRAANITWQGLDLSDVKEMDFPPGIFEAYLLKKNDILLNEASGSPSEVGKAAIWNDEISDCCFQNTIIRVRLHDFWPDYVRLHFENDARNGRFGNSSQGIGINHLGAERLANLIIALPPLAEQHRIVAKVDELMALCDELEAQLTATTNTRRQLLEATLHAALKEDR